MLLWVCHSSLILLLVMESPPGAANPIDPAANARNAENND